MANPIASMGWVINWIILDFNNLLEAMIERIDEEETGMRFNCKNCQKKTSSKQSILTIEARGDPPRHGPLMQSLWKAVQD